MTRSWLRAALLAVAGAFIAGPAAAGTFPMYFSWPQPGGPGSPLVLTYSFTNLLDGGMLDGATGGALDEELMRSAFERALWDYADVLPIHFLEVLDQGPPPETGEYDRTGLADIRVGQVPHIDGANAYAYFPFDITSGLAGDIVFNAERSGLGWTPLWFYAVSQHELGHSLGMGHYVADVEELGASLLGQELLYDGPVIPLTDDMVAALQGVYGAGVGSVTALPEPQAALVALGLLLLHRFGRGRHVPPGRGRRAGQGLLLLHRFGRGRHRGSRVGS